MKKRFLGLLLALVLVLSLLPTFVLADNLQYSIVGDTMTVSGTSIPDYDAADKAPWAGDEAAASVTKIVVSEDVTAIGAYAFAALPNVQALTIPGTLTSLAKTALPTGFTAVISYPTETGSSAFTYDGTQDYAAPAVPAREYYSGAWSAVTMNKNETATLSPSYTPVSYDAVFTADGETVATVSYTVETTALTEPEVPQKSGYTGAWESYTLQPGGMTISASYSLAVYTAAFAADGKTVSSQTFTVENKNIAVPAVPQKTGYTGAWENYSLGAADLTIQAVYTPIVYHAVFTADGTTVSTVPFTIADASLKEPAVPQKSGYTGAWESYRLAAADLTVRAVYTFAPYTGTVTASYLNIRSGPSTGASLCGGLPRGSAVTITEEQSGDGMTWGKLANGTWVSLSYVSKPAAASGASGGASGGTNGSYTATVNASTLNVRSGAGLGYGVQRGLSRGSSVTVTEEQASGGMTWCRLSGGGWVSKNYLSNIQSISGGSSQTAQPSQPAASVQPSAGSSAYTAVVNASYLYIRSGPGTSYGRLGGLSRGTAVTVTEEKTDGSYMVWGKTSSGWVSKTYLTVTGSAAQQTPSVPSVPSTPAASGGKTYRVTASLLNTRTGPGTGYARVGSLSYGEIVTVTEQSGNWGKTSAGVYICMDYTAEMVQVDTSAFQNVYSTYVSDCATSTSNRKTNLILACQAINGTVLTPGSSFSFNDVVGQRTAAKGYKLAPYIGAGSVTYGGGICQVASTLYNAALLANLQIVERTQHSAAVPYVPLGRDATVNWGTLDFRFRNDSAYPILISAVCDGNTVTVSLLTKETVTPGNITLDVVHSGSSYRLNRYAQGTLNYSTVSYF